MVSLVAEKLIGAMRARRAAGLGISGQMDVERLREEYRELGTRFPPAEGVEVAPATVGSLPASWIRPTAGGTGTMLYLHGGGYIIGGLESHTAMATHIARATECEVLLIDYRLAPEHRFPAAVDDAEAAYRWLLARGTDPANVVIGGDSAGGGLAVAMLLRLREQGLPLPVAGFLISPWADLVVAESARDEADADPMVDTVGLAWMRDLYMGGADPQDPLATPLNGDLQGLPPLLIQVGELEILRSDSRRLAESIRGVGGEVELEEWPGMVHVWHFFAGAMPESNSAIDSVGTWVRDRLATTPTPTTTPG